MNDSADQICERMEQVRRSVGDDVKGIVDTAKTWADWRYHVKHHPWICVGAAAAVGFLLVPRKKAYEKREARDLAALLRKYDLAVAPPSQPANKGMIKTMIGAAIPMLVRSGVNLAQQRFAAGLGSPPMSYESRPPFEEHHIPR